MGSWQLPTSRSVGWTSSWDMDEQCIHDEFSWQLYDWICLRSKEDLHILQIVRFLQATSNIEFLSKNAVFTNHEE